MENLAGPQATRVATAKQVAPGSRWLVAAVAADAVAAVVLLVVWFHPGGFAVWLARSPLVLGLAGLVAGLASLLSGPRSAEAVWAAVAAAFGLLVALVGGALFALTFL